MYQETGMKVILIGHSLGGVVIDTYLRMHSDFNDYIQSFFAICVPFDGSSAKALKAPILGHTLDIPIKSCVGKGVQLMGSMGYMVNHPNG